MSNLSSHSLSTITTSTTVVCSVGENNLYGLVMSFCVARKKGILKQETSLRDAVLTQGLITSPVPITFPVNTVVAG